MKLHELSVRVPRPEQRAVVRRSDAKRFECLQRSRDRLERRGALREELLGFNIEVREEDELIISIMSAPIRIDVVGRTLGAHVRLDRRPQRFGARNAVSAQLRDRLLNVDGRCLEPLE